MAELFGYVQPIRMGVLTRRLIGAALLLGVGSVIAVAVMLYRGEKNKVIGDEQALAVGVGLNGGSGVIFRQGTRYTWILTAAHIVQRYRLGPGDYAPVEVFCTGRDRVVLSGYGKICGVDYERDLALVAMGWTLPRVAKEVTVLMGGVPAVGTEVVHVGRMGGLATAGPAPGMLSHGVVAKTNATASVEGNPPDIYDAVAIEVGPGSSGGGVYDRKTGRLLGIMVASHPQVQLGLMVPAREIVAYLSRIGFREGRVISVEVDSTVDAARPTKAPEPPVGATIPERGWRRLL